MSAPLPDQLDPWRAVQHGSSFAGVVPLQSLPRLAAAVLGAEGPARYAIEFGRDGDGRAVARGRVSMTLQLTCQRCLEAIAVEVDATIALALVRRVAGADDLGLTADRGRAGRSGCRSLGPGPDTAPGSGGGRAVACDPPNSLACGAGVRVVRIPGAARVRDARQSFRGACCIAGERLGYRVGRILTAARTQGHGAGTIEERAGP